MPVRSHASRLRLMAWPFHLAIAMGVLASGGAVAASGSLARGSSALELMAQADAELVLIRGHIDAGRLDKAKPLLDKLLQSAPDSAAVRRLYAQYHLTESHGPESLQAAHRHLAHAVRVAPADAANYVLQGFVLHLQGRREDARAALERAEQLGSTDPWLHLNWGNLLLDEGKQEPAAARFRKVLEIKGLSPVLESEARWGLATYFIRAGRLGEADRMHKALMAVRGNDPYSQTRYAQFLYCARDDYETAIAVADKARGQHDSADVRVVLAAALFRKWSEQVHQGKAEDAAATLQLTRPLVNPNPVAVSEMTCRFSRNIEKLLVAMQKTGEGFRMPASAAVQMVSQRRTEDGPAPGIYALSVQGTGRQAGRVFLNSEPDYREPLNLTIDFTPEAVQAFSKVYGAAPDVALEGRAIEVRGYARKVKIAFRANGIDTGKFYYQTHVTVDDPAQVSFALSQQ